MPDSPDTTTSLQLSASEAATVRQALSLLLDTLSRDEGDQVAEIQAILARLPAAAAA
jgi:hypothetical protein